MPDLAPEPQGLPIKDRMTPRHEGLLTKDGEPTGIGKLLVYLNQETHGFEIDQSLPDLETKVQMARITIDKLVSASGLPPDETTGSSSFSLAHVLEYGKPLGKRKTKDNLSLKDSFKDLSTEELAKIDADMTQEDLEIINNIYAKTYIELSELAKDAGKENDSFSAIGTPESRRAFASSRAALALTLQKEIRKELPNLENLPIGINPTIFADIKNLFFRDEINDPIFSHDNWAEEFSQKENLLKANARLLTLGWKGVRLEYATIINFINETPRAATIKASLNKLDENNEHWGEVWQQITEAIFNSSNLSDFYRAGSSARSDSLYNISMLAWVGNRLITENNMTEPGKNTLVRNLSNKKNLLELVKEAIVTKKPTQPQA